MGREVEEVEVVAVGQNLRSISSQAGLQLLNVLVILTLSHRSFNYNTDHGWSEEVVVAIAEKRQSNEKWLQRIYIVLYYR